MSDETVRAKDETETSDSPSSRRGSNGARVVENPLSEREMDVAELLVTGATNNEIAGELVISPHTVKVHLRNIYEKLEVNSRTEASTLLLQQGWVALPGVEVGPADTETEQVPELPPLNEEGSHFFTWQPPYLVAAIFLSALMLFLPAVDRLGTSSAAGQLTDGEVSSVVQPAVDLESRWNSRTPLPSARSRFAAVSLDERFLYAIGGEQGQSDLLRRVDVYDLDVNEWESVSSLPIPLSNLAATIWMGQIYVAGGSTIDASTGVLAPTDRLWQYDPDADAWQLLGELPARLAGSSLVSVEEGLYLLGGWDGQSTRADVWHLPLPVEETVQATDWRQVDRMDEPRAFSGAVVVGDLIYVAGGYNGKHELRSVQTYSPAEDEWQTLPQLNTPRGGMSLLYDGLAIYAVGGGWTQPANTLERFDLETNRWSHFTAPISGEWRNLGAVASQRGYLHLLGGWSNSYLNTHLQYQSTFRTFLPSTRNNDSGGE